MHRHSSYTVVFHHVALFVHCGEQHDGKEKKGKQATTPTHCPPTEAIQDPRQP
jgi:hypothetical protein